MRIDFSEAGKETIYAKFPKKMNIKGQKLGEWPELAIPITRDMVAELAAGGLKAKSVLQVIDAYEANLGAKVKRNKLGASSEQTYLCCTKDVRLAFSDCEFFSRLINILDE